MVNRAKRPRPHSGPHKRRPVLNGHYQHQHGAVENVWAKLLAALALLLFTFACAALSQSFARSGNYSEPSVDPFFTNNTDYSAAQAGWWWLENAAPAA